MLRVSVRGEEERGMGEKIKPMAFNYSISIVRRVVKLTKALVYDKYNQESSIQLIDHYDRSYSMSPGVTTPPR